ncbi:HK97 family phage prohead protease [Paenirhodobacter populi]|uniref:HK97 family phage prohead protease n=1 Tax=Paenirhodobacter populi TaxID=2306993 RepID=A0A443J122_9RHOB|nr:HK97 family phage prohead protease [Sinirhodobacter populi]RWR14311.1 HK97 family phage prohead protease [Sinirhodobacter populi]
MLWGDHTGSLELRSDGGTTRLTARFPYGRETEIAAGRREVIAPRAFRTRIEAGDEIHLLSGHDYEKPLASRSAGTLTLTDSDDALTLEARIDGATTWARDFLSAHAAGLIRGLSPGFRVPSGGERIERRGADILRTIASAELFELSAVTRPAYSEAQIEARNWQPVGEVAERVVAHHLNRWRL